MLKIHITVPIKLTFGLIFREDLKVIIIIIQKIFPKGVGGSADIYEIFLGSFRWG